MLAEWIKKEYSAEKMLYYVMIDQGVARINRIPIAYMFDIERGKGESIRGWEGEVLDANTSIITESHTENLEKVLGNREIKIVSGETFQFKGDIKKYGFRWDSEGKVWRR